MQDERALRVIYLDKASSYEDLLKRASLARYFKRKKVEGHIISDVKG